METKYLFLPHDFVVSFMSVRQSIAQMSLYLMLLRNTGKADGVKGRKLTVLNRH